MTDIPDHWPNSVKATAEHMRSLRDDPQPWQPPPLLVHPNRIPEALAAGFTLPSIPGPMVAMTMRLCDVEMGLLAFWRSRAIARAMLRLERR